MGQLLHPPWAPVLGKGALPWRALRSPLALYPDCSHRGRASRQAETILPDQRVAEAQDRADQPELRREAGKEGEVGQADFEASDQKHKG